VHLARVALAVTTLVPVPGELAVLVAPLVAVVAVVARVVLLCHGN
jgi:hypothetical protein